MLQAWDLVTPMTITRCCRHAGIKHPGGTGSTHDEDEEECLPLTASCQTSWRWYALQTHGILSDQDIPEVVPAMPTRSQFGHKPL